MYKRDVPVEDMKESSQDSAGILNKIKEWFTEENID